MAISRKLAPQAERDSAGGRGGKTMRDATISVWLLIGVTACVLVTVLVAH
jgi:hypothetical protein